MKIRLLNVCLWLLLTAAMTILPNNVFAELTTSILNNAEYYFLEVDSQDKLIDAKYKFINGGYESKSPGDTMYAGISKIVYGDLNGDGKKDAAVILGLNTGGSGDFVQVAAVLDVNGKPQHVASRYLGDRTDVDSLIIKKGYIICTVHSDYFQGGKRKRTIRYQLKGNKLIGPKPFKEMW